jgi:hypothetical protein
VTKGVYYDLNLLYEDILVDNMTRNFVCQSSIFDPKNVFLHLLSITDKLTVAISGIHMMIARGGRSTFVCVCCVCVWSLNTFQGYGLQI